MADDIADVKGDRHKETVIVITGIVGLMLTYLMYRRSRSAASAGGTAPASGGVVNDPNSDGTQQLLAGILAAQQTLSGQLGEVVTNTTSSKGTTTPSQPTRATALFHFGDLHGKAPTLRDIAMMVYGIATPGNMNALQKANNFTYAGGHSGSDTRITGVNRGTGIKAPLPPIPLATLQHVHVAPLSNHV